MTEQTKEKLTPTQIAEKQEQIKAKYEADVKEKNQEILNLQGKITDKDNQIFEKDKQIEKLTEEKDDWKQEAHAARKVQSETKQHKETTDFLTEFKKLQAKKGLTWDETNETWIQK